MRRRISRGVVNLAPGVMERVRQGVAEVHGEGEERDEIRSYLEKAPENRRLDRLRPAKAALVVGGVVRTLWVWYSGQPASILIPTTLFFLACAISLDPVGILHRVLATQSRYLIGASLFCWSVFAKLPGQRTVLVSILVTVSTGIMVGFLNKPWLARETYRRTDRVLEAIRRAKSIPIDDMWEQYGAAECMAVAYDMGAVIKDGIEPYVRRACWILGLITGTKSVAQAIKDRDKAQRERDGLQIQVATLQAQVDAVQDYIELMEEDRTECIRLKERLKDETLYASSLRTQASTLQEELEKAQAEAADYKARLANLIKARQIPPEPEPELEEPEPTEPTDAELIDWLCTINPDTGEFYGIKRTMKEFGMSEWKVRTFIKNHKEEIEERRKEA